MKTISIATILDGLLSFVAISFASLCLMRLARLNLSLSISISLILGLCLGTMIAINASSKSKKRLDERASGQKKKALVLTLATMPNSEIINLFKALFEKMHSSITVFDGFLKVDNYLIYPLFLPDKLNCRDVAEIKKKMPIDSNDKLVVISSYFSQDAISLAENLQIKLIGINEVFDLIKEQMPSMLDTISAEKRLKLTLAPFFKRKQGLRFLLYGIALDLMGLISFFPVYYVTIGTIFTIYGIITMFIGKKTVSNVFSFNELLNSNKE